MTLAHPRKVRDTRLLIIEDESRMRDLLVRACAGWGFEAAGARNGEEALRLSEEDGFDIAVLDLNLPGMDGLETLRRLRQKSPDIAGIVLTGFASIDAAKRAVHLDVVEFLTKPCHLGELERALDRALRKSVVEVSVEQESAATTTPAEDSPLTLDEVERNHILQALRRHAGNRTAAARELGISRRTLYYKLDEYQQKGYLPG
jgi:DNA-binding NtrC family response regulator